MKSASLLKLLPLVITGSILWVTGGCYSTTGTVSREPEAYLAVMNVGQEVTASIDEGEKITLKQGKKPVRLQVTPGKHRIQVYRSGTLVVDRAVLVSDTQTLEVGLP